MSDKLRHCPHCGCELVKPRSLPDHRRLYAIWRAAAMHWPEAHPFRPIDETHLKAWSLVEARYHDTEFIAYPEECAENPAVKSLFKLAVEASYSAFARKRGHAFIRVSAGGVEIQTPRSISFAALSQSEFRPIREAVEEVLSAALGYDCDTLLREAPRAA